MQGTERYAPDGLGRLCRHRWRHRVVCPDWYRHLRVHVELPVPKLAVVAVAPTVDLACC